MASRWRRSARRLKLTLGDKPTLAIVGATPWTETLAETLRRAGTPVLLIDTFAGALDVARSKGIPTLQAELLSEGGDGEHARAPHRLSFRGDAERHLQQSRLLEARLGTRTREGLPAGGGRGAARRARRARQGVARTGDRRAAPGFADLAGSRHATASAFFLEKLEVDEDVGDDEMALLIVRPNGDLVFVSAEMPKVDLDRGRPRATSPAAQVDIGRCVTQVEHDHMMHGDMETARPGERVRRACPSWRSVTKGEPTLARSCGRLRPARSRRRCGHGRLKPRHRVRADARP